MVELALGLQGFQLLIVVLVLDQQHDDGAGLEIQKDS